VSLCGTVTARPADAQVSGGSISGVVTDAQAGGLQGAVVTIASPPVVKTATTAPDGSYRVADLAPGTYRVTSEARGFATLVRENVVVREGLQLSLDLTMPVGGVSEVVEVGGDTPMLESKSAVKAVNIGGDLQRALPLSALRTWADVLTLVPGITSTQARLQTYSLYGTQHPSGVALIDGADATSVLQGSTLYSQFGRETFSDIQVKTAGVEASTPLGLGAVVTVATQSGTDRFSGAASFQYEPRQWNADNTPGGQSLTITTRQSDLSLGGPIVRGHAWFFGSARIARNATGNPQSSLQASYLRALERDYTPLDNAWDNQIGFGKATWRAGRQEVLGSYHRDVTTLGGVQSNEVGLFRHLIIGGSGAFGRVTSAWNDSLLTRASIGYNSKGQENRNLQPNSTGVQVYQSMISSGGRLQGIGLLGAVGASPSAGLEIPAHMWNVTGDATYYTRGWARSHEFGAGVYAQLRHNEWNSHYSNFGRQLIEAVLRDPLDPASGFVPFRQQIFSTDQVTTLHVDSRDLAVYVQDAWRPSNRLTVSPGLRVDFVRRLDRIFDAVTQRSTEIGPRIGINYALTADQRNVVRASWGRIYDNLSVNETTAGTNVAGFVDLYDPLLDGSFPVSFVTPPVSRRSSNVVIDLDHYHQAHVNELVAGYQRQLPGQMSVDVSVLRREYRERPAAVESNAVYEGRAFSGYADPSQNQIYRLTANTWNWPVLSALQLEAAKRTARLQVIGSYTRHWNHLAGTWQPNDPASFIQPDAFAHANGIGFIAGCTSGPCADSDSYSGLFPGTWAAHVARAGASAELPWNVQLATSYAFQSGPWSGPILTRLPAADPAFGPATVTLSNGRVVSNPLATPIRFAHETRRDGQFSLPAVHVWNVRVGRTFPIGRWRLETAADVFNVTNHDADQALQIGGNQQYNPFFGTGMTRQFPRALQLSARLLF
jgi:hypothetical protein